MNFHRLPEAATTCRSTSIDIQYNNGNKRRRVADNLVSSARSPLAAAGAHWQAKTFPNGSDNPRRGHETRLKLKSIATGDRRRLRQHLGEAAVWLWPLAGQLKRGQQSKFWCCFTDKKPQEGRPVQFT